MEVIFRPIEVWPRTLTPEVSRHSSPFKATYNNTLQLLDRELRHLRAKQIVIQLALREDQIRLDSLPYANAKPSHPGVILSLQSKHGALSYPCDRYRHWEANLRAIALALEALRAVDRYGVTKTGEQYRGWQKLEAPAPFNPAVFLAQGTEFTAEQVRWDRVARRTAYKQRAMHLHPDVGGSVEAMQRLNQALEALGG